MKKRRPNILFAIADDASHLGSRMANFIDTPACDFVIDNGVFFNNSFTSNPKCAPSRASILTGKHTWQLEESCTHFNEFPSKFDLYPDILEENGYKVGYTGKGWGPGDWAVNGLKRNPAGPEFNDIKLIPPENSGIKNCDYAENFNKFLDEKDDEPFYFWFGCFEPHRKYIKGEGQRAGKLLDSVIVPSYLPDDDEVKNDLLDYASEVDWFDKHLEKMIDKLRDIGELENTLIVVTSDNGMPFPRVKGNMYEADFNLPLLMCWKDKVLGNRTVDDIVSFIDFMPTFLELAGVNYSKELPGKSLTDILLSNNEGIVNPVRDKVFMGRERHDMGRENDYGYPVRCIRTSDYLYVRNFDPTRWPNGNPETGYSDCDSSPTKSLIINNHEKHNEDYYFNLSFGKRPLEELYNIKEDKDCLNNLADNSEYKDVKSYLWTELENELLESKDPRIMGNGDIFETYTYANKAPHSWANYIKGTWTPQKY